MVSYPTDAGTAGDHCRLSTRVCVCAFGLTCTLEHSFVNRCYYNNQLLSDFMPNTVRCVVIVHSHVCYLVILFKCVTSLHIINK